MKNFFKKLSFVLAVAMVLTSLTPAVASAASKNFVTLKGNSSKAVTSVYAWIGGVTRNLDYNIGGKTSGVKGTWKSNNTKVVKVNASTGVLTPVANGTTTVTFTPSNGKNAVKTTVKVRTRAAALHIYDKAEYATGVKNPLEEKEGVTPSAIEMKVGDTLDLKVTMPLSKKQQDAGAKIASYFTYAEVDDNAVVEAALDPESNQRGYTLTAKAVGETTVTIVANQTTQANVRNGKYFREGKITVKVVDAFGAKQTGANKITVTGADLTTDVADYVVKRGASVTNIKEITVNTDKTEAVLEASATNLTAGNYTVSFKEGEAMEFAVESAVVANIEILSDVAVLHPDYTTKATATYKVTNQFGEDVTKNSTLAGTDKLTISGGERVKDGIVEFTSTLDYRVNVDIVALTIVCNVNGVNAQKTLTVSNKAVLDTIEYVGVYMVNNSGDLEATELKEKTTKEAMNNGRYYVLFSGKDQYGTAYETVTKDEKELNVVISGIPGVIVSTTEANLEVVEVKGVKYLAVRLTSAYDALNAGDCDVLAVATMSGKTASGKFTVAPAVKVDTVSISTSEVYANTENELEFEILDTDGNLVTDYQTLVGSKVFNDVKPKGTLRLERKSDGKAKLVYIAASNTSNDDLDSFTIMSETNKVCLVRLTIRKDPVPTKITAIKGVGNGKNLGVVSGNSVTIAPIDITVVDQYGNPYTKGLDNVSITAVKANTDTTNNYFDVTGAAISGTTASALTTILTVTGTGVGTTGTLTFTLNGKEESACVVKVVGTKMDNVTSNVQIEVPELMYQGTQKNIKVKAMINGSTVTLNEGQYHILGASEASPSAIKAPMIEGTEVKTETFTVTVTVNGADYTKEVKYSNATRAAVSAGKPFMNPQEPTATSGAITFADLVNLVEVKDQYGDTNQIATNRGVLRAKVDIVAKAQGSDIAVDTLTNNTANVKITNPMAGDIFEVTYDFGNGKTSVVRFTVKAAQ